MVSKGIASNENDCFKLAECFARGKRYQSWGKILFAPNIITFPEERMNMEKGKKYEHDNTNLSDFVLFLSVMQNKKAYQDVLSIILDEPDIKIKDVKVERVVLNKSGKRAIRLDAWGLSEDSRQFNMEMENHSENDYIPKRSRFYQGLMDSPILKSGRNTKYKELPSTVIIFITQEDIFKRDRAMYTFTERCEEVEDLRLEDGTTKIFLNMASKNGSKVLVSLLQYMKETDINNPEVEVKDERILELDEIVAEVKSSEEWEDARMTIYEQGVERGIIEGLIMGLTEAGFSEDRIIGHLQKHFEITQEEARDYYAEFVRDRG